MSTTTVAATTDVASFAITTHYYHYDQQGVVFNMWYLSFLEDARNAWFAHRGYPLEQLLADGFDIQVVHVDLAWKAAVRYGDHVRVEVRTERVGTTSLTLAFAVLAGDEVCASGTSTYVIVDGAINGKAAVPPAMRDALLVGGTTSARD
ncbi:acyl-CoA thioesterase [Nocardioides sp. SYSU DS0651]|uniref:acyl-CoA thioesterase n=1 Tax=Nocardioides sp. SYSU DS0651 TaxID=3415955 RepID=UPI003F4BE183